MTPKRHVSAVTATTLRSRPRNRWHQSYCSQPLAASQAKPAASTLARFATGAITSAARPTACGAWSGVGLIRLLAQTPPQARRVTNTASHNLLSRRQISPPYTAPRVTRCHLHTSLWLIGLLAQLTDSALQENIASTTAADSLGQQVQAPSPGGRIMAVLKRCSARSACAGSAPCQLDRPPPVRHRHICRCHTPPWRYTVPVTVCDAKAELLLRCHPRAAVAPAPALAGARQNDRADLIAYQSPCIRYWPGRSGKPSSRRDRRRHPRQQPAGTPRSPEQPLSIGRFSGSDGAPP